MKAQKKVFLMENDHLKKLQIYLYISTIDLIVFFYFIFILIFSTLELNLFIIFSAIFGFFIYYKKDNITKKISNKLFKKEIKNRVKKGEKNLELVLNTIVPKGKKSSSNKFKLNKNIEKIPRKSKKEMNASLDGINSKYSKNKSITKRDYIHITKLNKKNF